MSAIKTIDYVVNYKIDRDTPQHEMTFRNQSAAIAFAFTIEVEGGVAMVIRREKETPFSGRSKMSLDDDSFN